MSERIVFEGSSRLLFLQHTLLVVLVSLIVFFLFYILIVSRKPLPLSHAETVAIEDESRRAPIRAKLTRIKESLITLKDEVEEIQKCKLAFRLMHVNIIAKLLSEVANDLVHECISARAYDLKCIDQKEVNIMLLFNRIEGALEGLETFMRKMNDETILTINATGERLAFGKFLAIKKCERHQSSNVREALNLTDANG